jgi:hypothetical protein
MGCGPVRFALAPPSRFTSGLETRGLVSGTEISIPVSSLCCWIVGKEECYNGKVREESTLSWNTKHF